MGILAFIKHLAPLFLYVTGILFILKAVTGDGRWALLLLTFIIPLRNVIDKIQAFPMGSHIIDILIAIILVGLIFFLAAQKNQSFAPSTLNTILPILLIYMFISLLIGGNYLYGSFHIDFFEDRAKDWKNFCFMPLLFFITLNYMTEKKWIYRVLIVMAFAMIIMEYYTLSQIREYSLVSREKINGTFEFLGTNEAAAFFNEFTIVLIGITFFIKKRLIKWSLISMICINIFCILSLYSRGAYLGFFAGMFFLCLFKNRKFLIPLILVGVFWQSVLPVTVVDRIKQTTNENGQLDNSSKTRIVVWKQSLEMFKKSPLMGLGFGVFRSLGMDLGDTHNIYVKYLVEQGLIGFIIFLIVLFCFLRMGYVLYKKGEDDLSQGMGLGLMACVVVLMVNNFFGDRWSYLELSAYLWIFAGLVARLIIMAQNPKALPEVQKKTKTTTAVPLQKSKKKIRYYDL